MLRASLAPAKFGVSLDLGWCQHFNGEYVVLEMSLP